MTAVAASLPSASLRRGLRLFTNRLLRFPLFVKLAGANALIVLMAWTAAYLDQRTRAQDWRVLVVLTVAFAAGLAVNMVLLLIALRPIRTLEDTAARVWKGDLAARVPWSPIADAGLEKLAVALNILLETLARDRSRARALTSEVIRLGDQQRAEVAKELHESLAQSLAGLMYRVTAAQRDCQNESCKIELEAVHGIAEQCMEEMRNLSGRVHPRMLDEFGLLPALRHLARINGAGDPAITVYVVDGTAEDLLAIPPASATVLYRVAEEALRNALRHAHALRIEIGLRADPDYIYMKVQDDGVGFEPSELGLASRGTGLALMRERIAFADGHLEIESAPGGGTSVRVQVPRAQASIENRSSDDPSVGNITTEIRHAG